MTYYRSKNRSVNLHGAFAGEPRPSILPRYFDYSYRTERRSGPSLIKCLHIHVIRISLAVHTRRASGFPISITARNHSNVHIVIWLYFTLCSLVAIFKWQLIRLYITNVISPSILPKMKYKLGECNSHYKASPHYNKCFTQNGIR